MYTLFKEITRNETVWRMRTNNVKGVYLIAILIGLYWLIAQYFDQ